MNMFFSNNFTRIGFDKNSFVYSCKTICNKFSCILKCSSILRPTQLQDYSIDNEDMKNSRLIFNLVCTFDLKIRFENILKSSPVGYAK